MQELSVIRREMRAYDWLEAECPDAEDHLEGGLAPGRVTIPSRLMLVGRAGKFHVRGRLSLVNSDNGVVKRLFVSASGEVLGDQARIDSAIAAKEEW